MGFWVDVSELTKPGGLLGTWYTFDPAAPFRFAEHLVAYVFRHPTPYEVPSRSLGEKDVVGNWGNLGRFWLKISGFSRPFVVLLKVFHVCFSTSYVLLG